MSIIINNKPLQLLLLSIFSLGLAYDAEYVFSLNPCPLCVYQRFPYLIFIYISIMALQDEQNYIIYCKVLLVTIIASIALAGYHSGVERGIFEMSALCKPLVTLKPGLSILDFKKMLSHQTLGNCSKAPFKFIYLSMTEWNLVFNLFLLVVCGREVVRGRSRI
jgi:disulfide bond formation protein DsbB